MELENHIIVQLLVNQTWQIWVKNHMNLPDSKVHGANMGPIWGREDPGGPNVGPMYFAIWVIMGRLLVGVQKLHTDSKVHGANMGSIWGWQDPCGPHVGPMNFVIWLGSVNFHWAVRTCSEVDMAKHC